MRIQFLKLPAIAILGVITTAVFLAGVLYEREKHVYLTLTLDNLPKEAVLVEHPEDVAEAKLAGGIAMRHYATPEAMKAGGPIYGTMGYRIVAIEYEIPAKMVKERTIGKESAGWKLVLNKLGGIRYDHFHIGFTEQKHAMGDEADSHSHSENGGGAYLIHFMLISHEEEIAYGLVCG